MEKADDLDAALQMAYKQLPANPETVVIPDGGTVLPVLPVRQPARRQEKLQVDQPRPWNPVLWTFHPNEP